MLGWINDITYRINEKEESEIVTAIKLENGDKKVVKIPFKPYFYIKKEDKEKLAAFKDELKDIIMQESDFKTPDNKEVIKIIVKNPKQVKKLRQIFETHNIETYESDIRFVYRFLIDHDYRLLVNYDEKNNCIKPHYIDLNDKNISLPIKVTSIDIENVYDEIKLISFETREFYYPTRQPKLLQRDLIIVGKNVSLNNVNVKMVLSEKELIEETIKKLQEINPDIIVGWNLIDFDFSEIQKKAKKYGIKLKFGMPIENELLELKLTRESSFLKSSEAEVFGIWICDAMHMIRSSFIKLEDYTLNSAARTILEDEKIDLKGPKREMINHYYTQNPTYLAKYNMKDAQLVLDIIEKEKLIELYFERAIATGLILQKVGSAIVALDSLYIREARKKKVVVNNVKYEIREFSISGGYVREPKPGLYDFINVLDFNSLYPSIMRTFNIDPYTFSEDGEIIAPNGARFRKEKGILPLIIDELFERRKYAKKIGNRLMSQAIKITMNSFYGVLGNPNCRFFKPLVADAIPSFGRLIVKTAANYVIEQGYDVIYGDTDSIFIKSNAKNYEEAKKIGKKHEEEINKFFSEWCKKKYGVESKLTIEYEKTYAKFLMPSGRSGGGVKKRYAGLIIDNGKEEIDITGLEAVRSDWTDLARKFQYDLLWKLFHNENIEEYIKKVVDELKKGKYDEQLVYKKKLRKMPDKYTKTTPPHVKAARLLNKISSPVIKYVITINGPEPIERLKSKIDYEHYIEKQLKPIANQILEFYGKTFDDILKGTQKTLFDFK